MIKDSFVLCRTQEVPNHGWEIRVEGKSIGHVVRTSASLWEAYRVTDASREGVRHYGGWTRRKAVKAMLQFEGVGLDP